MAKHHEHFCPIKVRRSSSILGETLNNAYVPVCDRKAFTPGQPPLKPNVNLSIASGDITEKSTIGKPAILTAKRCGQSGQQTRQYPN